MSGAAELRATCSKDDKHVCFSGSHLAVSVSRFSAAQVREVSQRPQVLIPFSSHHRELSRRCEECIRSRGGNSTCASS